MVIVIGTLRFPPEALAALRPALTALVETTRRDDGCHSYDVAEDLLDPGLLRFSESWPDRASLARHLTAPHIAPWRTAAAAAGLMARSFTAFEAGASWPV